ncbi:MAG: phosphate acyltransferase [Bacteroidota bacterium]|nr:phosphate acyltransferase [Bacteroidota bacterium]
MSITKLDQIVEAVKSRPRKRLIAAYANDKHTIEAISKAIDLGIVEATLVGDTDQIEQICKDDNIDAGKFTIIHQTNENKAAVKAVELINKGEGNLIMKGLLSTDKYMRAILNKETGLMDPGSILSHVTVIENPAYRKLIICGDVAIIPLPDLKQKIAITGYLIETAHALGIKFPKVAAVTATEQILSAMPACIDAAIIAKMGERGQFKEAFIDGPLSFDVAIDQESAEIKNIGGPVAGDADCLLFPNIEAGNIFYKTNTKFCKAELGAFVAGARVPAILSSRGDTTQTKMYSIALSALVSKH